jgi:predicted  nucleic acid-binding Zn-ribbon protein
MQSLYQQPKTSDGVEPDAEDKAVRETFPANLTSRRRRDLLDEDEHPHSHVLRWTIVVVILAALIVAGAYSYRTVGAHFSQLSLLPAMHDQIGAASHRIDAAEETLRSWTSQRDAWVKRLDGVESRIDGTLRAARKQTEEIVARAQQNMRAEVDQRTASLAVKMDRLQTVQQSADSQLKGFQEQLNQVQAANGREVAQLREELRQTREAHDAAVTDLDRHVARVDQRSSQSTTDLESIHSKIDREQTEFELGVNHDRELAQGVNMDVSHTDVLHQRFDGWIFLMPDRKTIWIHSRGIQQPVTFYTQGDERPRELVITRVTKYSVIGYILRPRQNAAATSGDSRFDTGGLAVPDSQETK